MSTGRPRPFAILGASLLARCACGPAAPDAPEAMIRFMTAVQEEDLDRLFCLSAGAEAAEELGADDDERRANFRTWPVHRKDAEFSKYTTHGIRLKFIRHLRNHGFCDFTVYNRRICINRGG